MDKDKVMPVLLGAWDRLSVAEYQRDADFAVLEQVAEAVEDIDRYTYYLGVRRCGGCGFVQDHDGCCPWQKLKALGIVEKV